MSISFYPIRVSPYVSFQKEGVCEKTRDIDKRYYFLIWLKHQPTYGHKRNQSLVHGRRIVVFVAGAVVHLCVILVSAVSVLEN